MAEELKKEFKFRIFIKFLNLDVKVRVSSKKIYKKLKDAVDKLI